MVKYLEAKGITVGAPTWGIYLNDPDAVASDHNLETNIYVTAAVA